MTVLTPSELDHEPRCLRQHESRIGYTVAEANGTGGFVLPGIDRQNGASHGFGIISADIKAKTNGTGCEWFEIDADLRAAEIENEKLQKARRAAKNADIGCTDKTQRPETR